MENSNYLLQTEAGSFILTLYEKRVNPADLPFFIGLMEHLAKRGIDCPQPVRNREGVALGQLAGRPALIATFLVGTSVRRPTAANCAALGAALAGLHKAGADFTEFRRVNALSVAGWRPLYEQARERADTVAPGLAALIADELSVLEARWPRACRAGVIHADLFPDNVFFTDGKLSGIDRLLLRLQRPASPMTSPSASTPGASSRTAPTTRPRAVHCSPPIRPSARWARKRSPALPLLARGAALRFLLTRLVDWLNVPPGALVRPHDPVEYLRKLRFHRSVTSPRDYGVAERQTA